LEKKNNQTCRTAEDGQKQVQAIHSKIDKKSTQLVAFLQEEKDLRQFHTKTKFWLYDLLLLDILNRHNELGASIFSSMFKKGNPTLILNFR
jgi:lycopene beta-cyclase